MLQNKQYTLYIYTSNISLNAYTIETCRRTIKGKKHLPSSHRAPLKPEKHSRGQKPVT